jgi:hypothetical protein
MYKITQRRSQEKLEINIWRSKNQYDLIKIAWLMNEIIICQHIYGIANKNFPHQLRAESKSRPLAKLYTTMNTERFGKRKFEQLLKRFLLGKVEEGIEGSPLNFFGV